jgi:hypothetical protein
MINLGKKSKHDPPEVIRRAVAFFGEGGLGLAVRERTESSVQFENGGGFVGVTATAVERGSDVTVQSQEWDYQAQQFLERI